MTTSDDQTKHGQRGFTLLELLVVTVIGGVLAALIVGVVQNGKETAQRTACVSNLRQIGIAIGAYVADHDGMIPFGPKAPPFTSPSQLYPSTGAPTSLISLKGGEPVGLGLLLKPYLERKPTVLFCPGSDQPVDAEAELAKVGKKQAQCSYYYRHAGNTEPFDNPRMPVDPATIRLSNLGTNRDGDPVTALVMDTMFDCDEGMSQFGVLPRSHHGGKFVNVLYVDGSVRSLPNTADRYRVDITGGASAFSAFSLILKAYERADDAQSGGAGDDTRITTEPRAP